MICSLVLGLESNITSFKGDIIGVDRGSLLAIEKGFIPKIAIGDFDSCSEEEIKKISSKTSLIKLNPEKDDTDTLAAIKYVIELGYDEIYLFNGIGARIDHSFANIILLLNYPQIKSIISKDSKIMLLTKGYYEIKENYKYVSLFSVEDSLVTLKKFKYNLENYLLKNNNTLGISNEFTSEIASVEIIKGKILLMLVNE